MAHNKKDFLEMLGVTYDLESYATCPWSHYDEENGICCNAEVRMDADAASLEADIQLIYDTPPEGSASMVQIFKIEAKQNSAGEWDVSSLKLHNKEPEEEIYNWQDKSCKFFSKVTEKLGIEEIPDFEALMEEIFRNERLADQEQGGGGKSPTINAQALLNIKQGSSM